MSTESDESDLGTGTTSPDRDPMSGDALSTSDCMLGRQDGCCERDSLKQFTTVKDGGGKAYTINLLEVESIDHHAKQVHMGDHVLGAKYGPGCPVLVAAVMDALKERGLLCRNE